MTKLATNLVLLFLIVLSNAGCGGMPMYSAAPIEAWVVDAETSQPLEGVVVTANWQLVEGSFAGGEIPKGQLMVMETVTDKNGRFYFEGWIKKNPTTGELRNQDPQILMFKPGYRFYRFAREFRESDLFGRPNRQSPISGQTVKLTKFKGSTEEYAAHFSYLNINLRSLIADCEWKSIPKMIIALDQERKRIKAINRSIYMDSPDIDSLEGYSARCGSARKFFEAYTR